MLRFFIISSRFPDRLGGDRMIPADDTRGDVWKAAGAWQSLACGVGDAWANRRTARADGPSCPMVEGHLEGILAHWTRGQTNAFMEGFNSFFLTVKRKARGYRTVGYMTAMLYFVDGKLTLPCY
jgi:hypothetical protein